MGLKKYCEQTSLHGWYYIFRTRRRTWKAAWAAVVIMSIAVASLFIYKAAEDFTKSTVVTTIHSTTEPLSEVYFPAVTICNINQVRKSFFNDLNINNNVTIVDLLYQQFYTGSDTDPAEEEQEIMKRLFTSETYVKNEFRYHRITRQGGSIDEDPHIQSNWTSYLALYREFIEKGFQFTRLAVQEPYGVMVLQASYGMKKRFGNSTDFNPYFGTDYGICTLIKPQLAFNRDLDHVPYWQKIFGQYNWDVAKGAEVGKANGLSILLDAETFDYTFHLKAGEGFKIAVHHHLDQPIMSIKEVDISPGSVFQIAVTPTLMSTTVEARDRFQPHERGCYVEGELPLKYLPSSFYRYEMSNCLFEAAYEKILEDCNCTPSFHQLAHKEVAGICTGPGLTCMNGILRFIGKLNKVGPNSEECLSACDDQINNVGVTSSDFPNRETFVKRDEFCITLKKLNRTCHSEKAVFLTNKFPDVCANIARISDRLQVNPRLPREQQALCDDFRWNPVRFWGFQPKDPDIFRLEEDIFQYAKKNLAVVNVYIKDPVVTRIMRDQKIPVIAFVANTGGLLGLCMGFSLVSVFEILYHAIGTLAKAWVSNGASDADGDRIRGSTRVNNISKNNQAEDGQCFQMANGITAELHHHDCPDVRNLQGLAKNGSARSAGVDTVVTASSDLSKRSAEVQPGRTIRRLGQSPRQEDPQLHQVELGQHVGEPADDSLVIAVVQELGSANLSPTPTMESIPRGPDRSQTFMEERLL